MQKLQLEKLTNKSQRILSLLIKANTCIMFISFLIFSPLVGQSKTSKDPIDIAGLVAKAKRGDMMAMYKLAEIYHFGMGVPRDCSEAVKWYQQAANSGLTAGAMYLGFHYEGGEGVPKNYILAAKWFRKAAEQGSRISQGRLGEYYFIGQGVPQDYAESYVWLSLSMVGGEVFDSGESLGLASQKLSPDALQQAKARVLKLHNEITAREEAEEELRLTKQKRR